MTANSPRLYFLDWLRIAAIAILVVYHVGMYYVTWEWHVKSPFASDALEPVMRLISPWRLALLFLISGAASSLMLTRESSHFLSHRSWRLLLPLVFGIFVVVPPQAYFQVIHDFAYGGSYIDFLKLYLSADKNFCKADRCLILPTWNHLWFVAYLWVYTALLWGLDKGFPRLLNAASAALSKHANGWTLLVLPITLLALLRTLLVVQFPSTHALVDDFLNHAVYFAVFMLGVLFARSPNVWTKFEQWRGHALGGALLAWCLLTLYRGYFSAANPPPDTVLHLQRLAYSISQWGAIVAALGFAYRHWNHDHRSRNYWVSGVFVVYILHQTMTILLSQLLLPYGLRPSLEAPVLVAGTFMLSLAGYESLRRVTLLRPLFGLPMMAREANSK
jgi:glucans biosynthesis protein C